MHHQIVLSSDSSSNVVLLLKYVYLVYTKSKRNILKDYLFKLVSTGIWVRWQTLLKCAAWHGNYLMSHELSVLYCNAMYTSYHLLVLTVLVAPCNCHNVAHCNDEDNGRHYDEEHPPCRRISTTATTRTRNITTGIVTVVYFPE